MTRHWKRPRIAGVMAWTLLTVLLVGCGGGENQGESQAANAPDLPAGAFTDDVAGVIWIDLTALAPERLRQSAEIMIEALPETGEGQRDTLRRRLDQALADYEMNYTTAIEAGLERVLVGMAASEPGVEAKQFILARMAETATLADLEEGLAALVPELPELEAYDGRWVTPVQMDEPDGMVAPTTGAAANRDEYERMLADGSGAIRIALRVNEAMKQQMRQQAAASPAAVLANPIARIETGLIEGQFGEQPKLGGRLTFTDAEAAQEFVTAWNGLVVQAQGMVAFQMAQMPEAPAPEQIERTFEPLKMSAQGAVATLEVDSVFLERAARTIGAMGELPLPMGPGVGSPQGGGAMPGTP